MGEAGALLKRVGWLAWLPVMWINIHWVAPWHHDTLNAAGSCQKTSSKKTKKLERTLQVLMIAPHLN